MNSLLRTSLPLVKSKEIAYVAGSDDCVFDLKQTLKGPNGGVWNIDIITVHVQLLLTNTVAAVVGADVPRLVSSVTIEMEDDEKRVASCRGDTLYNNSILELGSDRTHVHADIGVAAGQTVTVSVAIPMSKFFMYSPMDTSLPAWALRAVKVKMSDPAYASLGGTIAITSGKTWITAQGHEEMSVIHKAHDCIYEHDFDTAEKGEIIVGGRLQSLFLMIPGAGGGQTLANLSTLMVEGIHRTALYKNPDLTTQYARSRGEETGLFSTTGNPVRTNAFVAADAGTLRAVAPLLTNGHKCFEGPELNRATCAITVSAALPATPRMVIRAMKRKTPRLRELLMDTFDVEGKYGGISYIKAAGKSRRPVAAWEALLGIYLPEKFVRLDDKGQPIPGVKWK